MTLQKQTRFIRRLLYTLKKGYGFKVTFYKITSESLNHETGVRTPIIDYKKVNKVIILPSELQRKFESDTQTRDFHYGGYFDTAIRKLIVDPRDLGDFEIKTGDYYIWEGERFEVSKVFDLENQSALLILGRNVEGSVRYMIEDVSIESTLQLTQTIAEIKV